MKKKKTESTLPTTSKNEKATNTTAPEGTNIAVNETAARPEKQPELKDSKKEQVENKEDLKEKSAEKNTEETKTTVTPKVADKPHNTKLLMNDFDHLLKSPGIFQSKQKTASRRVDQLMKDIAKEDPDLTDLIDDKHDALAYAIHLHSLQLQELSKEKASKFAKEQKELESKLKKQNSKLGKTLSKQDLIKDTNIAKQPSSAALKKEEEIKPVNIAAELEKVRKKELQEISEDFKLKELTTVIDKIIEKIPDQTTEGKKPFDFGPAIKTLIPLVSVKDSMYVGTLKKLLNKIKLDKILLSNFVDERGFNIIHALSFAGNIELIDQIMIDFSDDVKLAGALNNDQEPPLALFLDHVLEKTAKFADVMQWMLVASKNEKGEFDAKLVNSTLLRIIDHELAVKLHSFLQTQNKDQYKKIQKELYAHLLLENVGQLHALLKAGKVDLTDFAGVLATSQHRDQFIDFVLNDRNGEETLKLLFTAPNNFLLDMIENFNFEKKVENDWHKHAENQTIISLVGKFLSITNDPTPIVIDALFSTYIDENEKQGTVLNDLSILHCLSWTYIGNLSTWLAANNNTELLGKLEKYVAEITKNYSVKPDCEFNYALAETRFDKALRFDSSVVGTLLKFGYKVNLSEFHHMMGKKYKNKATEDVTYVKQHDLAKQVLANGNYQKGMFAETSQETSKAKHSMLVSAIDHGADLELIKLILDAGHPVNYGKTVSPLAVCYNKGRLDLFQLLIQRGADYDISKLNEKMLPKELKTHKGKTLYEISLIDRKFEFVATILEDEFLFRDTSKISDEVLEKSFNKMFAMIQEDDREKFVKENLYVIAKIIWDNRFTSYDKTIKTALDQLLQSHDLNEGLDNIEPVIYALSKRNFNIAEDWIKANSTQLLVRQFNGFDFYYHLVESAPEIAVKHLDVVNAEYLNGMYAEKNLLGMAVNYYFGLQTQLKAGDPKLIAYEKLLFGFLEKGANPNLKYLNFNSNADLLNAYVNQKQPQDVEQKEWEVIVSKRKEVGNIIKELLAKHGKNYVKQASKAPLKSVVETVKAQAPIDKPKDEVDDSQVSLASRKKGGDLPGAIPDALSDLAQLHSSGNLKQEHSSIVPTTPVSSTPQRGKTSPTLETKGSFNWKKSNSFGIAIAGLIIGLLFVALAPVAYFLLGVALIEGAALLAGGVIVSVACLAGIYGSYKMHARELVENHPLAMQTIDNPALGLTTEVAKDQQPVNVANDNIPTANLGNPDLKTITPTTPPLEVGGGKQH